MTRSHLFVSSQTHEPSKDLWLTSSMTILSHAGGEHLYAFSSSGGGLDRDCRLLLEEGGGLTVSVACIVGEDEVCVVREKGQVELFSQHNLGWKRTGKLPLL